MSTPAPETPPPTTQVERWNAVRQLVEHKHTVINHRLTWAGTAEGFVFLLFVNFVQVLLKSDTVVRWPVYVGCLLLCVVGAVIPYFFIRDLQQHGRHLAYAYKFGNQIGDPELPLFNHGIDGKTDPGGDEGVPKGSWRPGLWTLPKYVAVMWAVAGLVVVLIAVLIPR